MLRFLGYLTTSCLAVLPTILTSPTTQQRRQPPAHSEYYLQTSVINGCGDCGTDKVGLYVASFHTGAGLSDAVLVSDISGASKGFLVNNTYQEFDYGSSISWYMDLGAQDYAGESHDQFPP